MWGEMLAGDPTPLGREVFSVPRDLEEHKTTSRSAHQTTRTIDPAIAALMASNITWPPADRGTADDFLRAVGPRRTTLKPFAAQGFSHSAAKIDHLRRTILLKMLKSGSSTMDHLFDPEQFVPNAKDRNRVNATEMMLYCMHSPVSKHCRSPGWVLVQYIPDEVHEAYFIITVVRDPFTRVISSLHEHGKGGFTNIISGKVSKVGQNVHFYGQFYTISRPILSGKQLRVDFVGRLESLAEDWARLQPAMGNDKRRTLSPRERQELILPSGDGAGDGAIPHHRVSEEASAEFLPYDDRDSFGNPEHFSMLHVILVCRRYIQDLVCFDMAIPKVCIEHAELVLDLADERDA
jgi:hypothetical protein